ncbi:MAG TPA: nucleotidyltransferase [Gaiellaceae bacterium]|nr:nucleotidyltransferase [Gaiellaceae bacterium]
MSSDRTFDALLDAMRHGAALLREHDIGFALAGSLAVYARGGPETDHDVDFVIKPEDVDRALEVFGENGWRCERPPEGWLVKVYDEQDSMIDLIFEPNHTPVDDDVLARADELEVYAIELKVMSVTDVLTTKLLALKEHEVDYESVLEVARACREQIEWTALREQTASSPYAKAFFTLVEELGLSSPQPEP